jgi:hypothetical protein
VRKKAGTPPFCFLHLPHRHVALLLLFAMQ